MSGHPDLNERAQTSRENSQIQNIQYTLLEETKGIICAHPELFVTENRDMKVH